MSLGSPWSPAKAQRVIPATPEQVFAVLADPWTYPEWLLGAQHIRAVDADFPRPGAVFHHSVGPTDESTIDDISEVVSVDPPHRLELRVHVGRLRGLVELIVTPDPEGSDVRFRERPAGLAVYAMPVLRPALHSRNAASLRKLETRVVCGPASPPPAEPVGST